MKFFYSTSLYIEAKEAMRDMPMHSGKTVAWYARLLLQTIKFLAAATT
jgi:hypothetical protein